MVAKVVFGVVSIALCVGIAVGFSTGPPAQGSTCNSLRPGSSAPHVLQDGNGTYGLTVNGIGDPVDGYFTYTPGSTYTGNIQSDGPIIRGFLVQAWDPAGSRIGSFGISTMQKHLTCSSVPNSNIADAATLIHDAPHSVVSISFSWLAPTTGNMVDFRFTIVRARLQYFGPLSAALPNGIIPPVDREPLPSSVIMPTRDPANYRITARNPPGCEVSSCSVFAAVDTNADSEWLDIYLEGEAKAWVAVGFSDTPSMFAADVIACNLQSKNATSSEVDALDTWNSATGRDNSPNMVNNAYLRTGSYNDGRLRCLINRRIVTTNETNDLPLNTSLYLLYGFGDDQAEGVLRSHRVGARDTPQVSPSRVNPATGMADFSADRVRPALTRLHGILMWVSWPVMGLTGMYFAFFMRPSLPNGEWFQAHRALMLASLFTGALGFFFIFVAQYRRQPYPGLINFNTGAHTAHFILGLITMAIHIINPLIAICRCKPGEKNRWIFNAIHGYGIGIMSVSLSLTTVGLGTSIFNIEVSSLGPSFNIFWVYVAYLVLYTVVISIGYNVIFWGIFPKIYKDKCCNESPPSGQEMKEKGGPDAQPDSSADEKPRKQPSKDSKYRWIAFIIFAIFNVLFGIAMIVLIAL